MSPPPLVGSFSGTGDIGSWRIRQFNSRILNVDLALDFLGDSSWHDLVFDAEQTLRPWSGVVPNICVSVPLCCSDDPSLRRVAAGEHDEAFRRIAVAIRQAGFHRPFLRIGWKPNAVWYEWGIDPLSGTLDARTYVRAWRRVAAGMKAILPDARTVFGWAGGLGGRELVPADVYPGDDLTDVVAFALHFQGIGWQPDPDATRCIAYALQGQQFEFWPQFARWHRKPWAVDELGIGDLLEGDVNFGPGDNPEVAAWAVAKLATYPTGDRPGGLLFVNLLDFDDADGRFRISEGRRPLIEAVYRAAWGSAAASIPSWVSELLNNARLMTAGGAT